MVFEIREARPRRPFPPEKIIQFIERMKLMQGYLESKVGETLTSEVFKTVLSGLIDLSVMILEQKPDQAPLLTMLQWDFDPSASVPIKEAQTSWDRWMSSFAKPENQQQP